MPMIFCSTSHCLIAKFIFTYVLLGSVGYGCAGRSYDPKVNNSGILISTVEEGIPLRMVETVPNDGAVEVPGNVSIKVYFNKKLEAEGASNDDSDLLVFDENGEPVRIGKADVVFEGPFMAWLATGTLDPGKRYTVRVDRIKSKESDLLEKPFEFSFTTASVAFNGTTSKDDADIASLIASARDSKVGEGDAIYRVQGGPDGKSNCASGSNKSDRSRERFVPKSQDKVTIQDDSMIFFSMGGGTTQNRADARLRALEFLVNRGENACIAADLPYLVKFEVARAYSSFIRYIAVPQSRGKAFPTRPQIVDYNQARDQYGLPNGMFHDLLAAVVPGTVERLPFDNSYWNDFPEMRIKADKILKQAGVK